MQADLASTGPSRRVMLAALLMGFGVMLLVLSQVYARDLDVLRSAPELVWNLLCGVPSQDPAALPVMVVAGEVSTLAGAALLALGQVRRARTRWLVLGFATAAVIIPLVSAILIIRATAPLPEPEPGGITRMSAPVAIADFTLTDQFGQPRTKSQLMGRPSLIFFGYTHCPDVCPIALAEYRRISRDLGSTAASVNLVFISVDGARDTPEVMRQYVDTFNADIVGLSDADPQKLRAVATSFGAWYQLNPPESGKTAYTVDHSAQMYLLDRDANWRAAAAYGTPPERVEQELRALLR